MEISFLKPRIRRTPTRTRLLSETFAWQMRPWLRDCQGCPASRVFKNGSLKTARNGCHAHTVVSVLSLWSGFRLPDRSVSRTEPASAAPPCCAGRVPRALGQSGGRRILRASCVVRGRSSSRTWMDGHDVEHVIPLKRPVYYKRPRPGRWGSQVRTCTKRRSNRWLALPVAWTSIVVH